MRETRSPYTILVRKSLAKHPLRRIRRRWEDNFKMYLREICCEDGRWLKVAQDCVQCQALVLAVLTFGFCYF
jgi:hypothetical protein